MDIKFCSILCLPLSLLNNSCQLKRDKRCVMHAANLENWRTQLLSNSENSSKIVQPKQFPQAVQSFIDPRLLDGCDTDELTTFRALANSQPRLRSTRVPRRCCVPCALCADRTRPARARTRTGAASGLQSSSTEFHHVRLCTEPLPLRRP